ncbi:MAG: SurA N-terminal domain-containing protein [Sphingobacteriales bacterium]|nr:SurA N-terminal domain-containing protein [Sphingobacteriales bacterium]
MSIIQNIRDKYARIAVIAIALALVGFILTDYFSGRGGNLFQGNNSNAVGTVNGKKIDLEDFSKKVTQQEEAYKQQGYPVNAGMTQNVVEQTWNQEVSRILFQIEFDKLGMRIGKKEKGDILYGPNAHEIIKKAGTDENGNYDPVRAKQQVDQMMKNKDVPRQQKEDFNKFITELEEQRKGEKYLALFSNSINYPKWFVEKQMADNSQIAKISMVRVLYSDSMFVDSTIAVADKEIEEYINKHKDNFKQAPTRSINYVNFSAAPTLGDTLETLKQIAALKPEFDSTNDVVGFLSRNGVTDFYDGYSSPSQLSVTYKDSLLRLSKNAVFGPYLEGGNYFLAKMLDNKPFPDSVKCRHILLGTTDQQTGQLVDDSAAHKTADSIALAIKNGASFDSLETRFTKDKEAHKSKGVMTFSSAQIQGGMQSGNFAKEFGQFILFDGKPGDKKVVRTSFGWHYIEIMSFINTATQYKIAYLPREIIASKATDDSAQEKANAFFGRAHDQKSFDETFEKTIKPLKGTKGIATNIGPLDAQVNGVGLSRPFVKSIYNAKQGEVLKPERIGNDYVVAIVTEAVEEGTQSVAKARPNIEPLLRNKKKAETIKQKFGKITTLEAASAAVNKKIESLDSLRMGATSKDLGFEPRVRGAAFNQANKGKVVNEALEGVSGVYVISVENVTATASAEGTVADQRKMRADIGKQTSPGPMEALKNAATIKDKRKERY